MEGGEGVAEENFIIFVIMSEQTVTSKKPINITYFLGAGASFHSIPTVKDLPLRMNFFRTFIGNISSIKPQLKNKLTISLDNLANEARKHNTIDTYAKKLYLNGEIDKLRELKVFLSMSFLFWQYHNGAAENSNDISAKIDYRYISLISAFLKKEGDNIVLPPNIRFITWNYDLQLELTLEYFIGNAGNLTSVQNTFGSFPNFYGPIDNLKIIHLNGIAGIYNNTGKSQNALTLFAKGYKENDPIQAILSIYEKCLVRKEWDIDTAFCFSWENSEISKRAIHEATRIMDTTDYLVIIGYSFPVFNREIDRKLFKSFSVTNRTIYYQDPKANKNSLSNTFKIRAKSLITEIKEEDELQQFFLPFEF